MGENGGGHVARFYLELLAQGHRGVALIVAKVRARGGRELRIGGIFRAVSRGHGGKHAAGEHRTGVGLGLRGAGGGGRHD